METPPETTAERSPPLDAAVSKIAVAQICRSVGYHAAEPTALRSLSDVAVRYVAAVARSASAVANACGRTDSNLLDLVRAVESLTLPRGFAGASHVSRPPLESGVLKGLAGFVGSVDEVPFAKPIPRAPSIGASPAMSFARMGREPPFPHVPRWLPCFPESWWEKERTARAEEEAERGRSQAEEGGGGRRSSPEEFRALTAERERVRFQLGFKKRFGSGVGVKRRKMMTERSSLDFCDDDKNCWNRMKTVHDVPRGIVPVEFKA